MGNKGSCIFISYMDNQKNERARDVTVACTTKECCALKRDTTRSHGPAEVSLVLEASEVRLVSVPVEARLVLGAGTEGYVAASGGSELPPAREAIVRKGL